MDFIKKWYIYQKERFPVVMYGIYILAIAFAVFVYGKYQVVNLIIMFVVAFLQFFMVRIIDEFKDYEEDCKYRPYRPVPRGLITLKELKVVFIICAILQVAITFFVNSKGILALLIMWEFFAIMSKGFFIKKFLDKHILCEVFLDELLMPLLVLYLSTFVCKSGGFNIIKLLILSYIVSWIVEIARKVRSKEDEEEGVKTYTKVLGIKKAMILLTLLETALMIIQTSILGQTYLPLTIGIYIAAILINALFAIEKTKKTAKLAELSANIYILLAYFSIGLLII